MKNFKHFASAFLTILTIATAGIIAQAQVDRDFAVVSSSGSGLKFDIKVQNAGSTLIIATPDGRIYRREFKEGSYADFSTELKDKLPDGHYTYELRLTPILSAEQRSALNNGRGKDDEPEDVRAARRRTPLAAVVQTGGFIIQNGSVIVAGQTEEQSLKSQNVPKATDTPTQSSYVTKVRRHHLSPMFMPDQVIPDDLIVQGSLCVGFDCVNNESFGFDTIRLKENNTRIQFDDTSVGSFPTNNWQIRANSSASGGESFLGFVDQGTSGNSETGTVVFQVNSGAPANSLKVAGDGRVGLRTGTPVLDLHINTGNTPAHRLEQNSSGGFGTQIWDIGANEANFFVRDVTTGSRLPFRIRPGAPTSSLDISATGNVGVGTASPDYKLEVVGGTYNNTFGVVSDDGVGPGVTIKNTGASGREYNIISTGTTANPGAGFFAVFDQTTGGVAGYRMVINSAGNVGIGTVAPTDKLSVNGTASKPGGGSWSVFSDERLKTINGNFKRGLSAVMKLQPLRYQYKPNNALAIETKTEQVGFGAQSLSKVIPEAVTTNEAGYLMVNNDPIIWTMLNAIKEQQQQIAELKNEVRKLRAATRRRK
ncbi:MAG TPA: tail fiber domain-containing protein [Pyrinomonadaceae bacterium]|nr:tail fiber domain-containing protein [Pyrinomonadaceae bacterium]